MEELLGSSWKSQFAPLLWVWNTHPHKIHPLTSLPPQDQKAGAVMEHPGRSAMQNTNLNVTSRHIQGHSSFFDTYKAHTERRTAVLETLMRPDLER